MPHYLQKNDLQEAQKNENNKIIKQKALTTEQSNQARMCTKIRSMVEKIFGVLKQNYQSLDYVRNSVIGHLAIDLKIAVLFIILNISQYFTIAKKVMMHAKEFKTMKMKIQIIKRILVIMLKKKVLKWLND
jgi:hypothetical protein